MTKTIQFSTDTEVQSEYYPKPADKFIPDWYKKTESYIGGVKQPTGVGSTTGTIKRCMPVFDAITAGYIIPLPVDIWIKQNEDGPYYEWADLGMIQFHPVEQAPLHPNGNGFPYPKFINPWAIRTEPGYSVMFLQPVHRPAPFTILTGIVDTDSYYTKVHFPFVLNDLKFEGLIPAGTPLAQVIPIKRDSWKMTQIDDMTESVKIEKRLMHKMFDRYKTIWWHKKDYR